MQRPGLRTNQGSSAGCLASQLKVCRRWLRQSRRLCWQRSRHQREEGAQLPSLGNNAWGPGLGFSPLTPLELDDISMWAGIKKKQPRFICIGNIQLKKPKQKAIFPSIPSLKYFSVTFFIGMTLISQVTGLILFSHGLPLYTAILERVKPSRFSFGTERRISFCPK